MDKEILRYLARQDWPVTIDMVDFGVSWNTAQIHLYKLMTEGRVKGRRVGAPPLFLVPPPASLIPLPKTQDRKFIQYDCKI